MSPEVLTGLKSRHPWVGVRHGAVGKLAKQIHQLRNESAGHDRHPPDEVKCIFHRGRCCRAS